MSTPSFDPRLSELIADAHWLRACVERYARPRHFARDEAANRSIGEELSDSLSMYGYRVSRQGPYRNVIAVPEGASRTRALICAHYDAAEHSPGADDDASGLAALLATARALDELGVRDVAFALFNAEDEDLLGSHDFVRSGMRELPEPPSEAHYLSMIGYRSSAPGSQRSPLPTWWPSPTVGDFLALIGTESAAERVQEIVELASEPAVARRAFRVWGPARRSGRARSRSEHAALAESDIPSILWTDTGEHRNPDCHGPGDVPESLDYEFLRGVTSLLVASLA